jgi:hypothetical protein
MGKTSSAVKNKWCAAHYSQIKIAVSPELAAAFKAFCKAEGTTVTWELSTYMSGRCGISKPQKRPPKDPLATRGGRRKLLAGARQLIEQVLDAESAYRDNIPENFHGAVNYEAAEQCVADLEEALELLEGAF